MQQGHCEIRPQGGRAQGRRRRRAAARVREPPCARHPQEVSRSPAAHVRLRFDGARAEAGHDLGRAECPHLVVRRLQPLRPHHPSQDARPLQRAAGAGVRGMAAAHRQHGGLGLHVVGRRDAGGRPGRDKGRRRLLRRERSSNAFHGDGIPRPAALRPERLLDVKALRRSVARRRCADQDLLQGIRPRRGNHVQGDPVPAAQDSLQSSEDRERLAFPRAAVAGGPGHDAEIRGRRADGIRRAPAGSCEGTCCAHARGGLEAARHGIQEGSVRLVCLRRCAGEIPQIREGDGQDGTDGAVGAGESRGRRGRDAGAVGAQVQGSPRRAQARSRLRPRLRRLSCVPLCLRRRSNFRARPRRGCEGLQEDAGGMRDL